MGKYLWDVCNNKELKMGWFYGDIWSEGALKIEEILQHLHDDMNNLIKMEKPKNRRKVR